MTHETWRPERRRDPRRDASAVLRVHVDGAGPALVVREVSEHGLVVEGEHPMTAGERVTVTIDDGEHLVGPLAARVVHSRLVLPVTAGAPAVCLSGIALDRLDADQARDVASLLALLDHRSAARSVPTT